MFTIVSLGYGSLHVGWGLGAGHLLVGPTATETTQRDNSLAPADLATEAMLQGEASRMLPAIEELAPLASYSGIRPATQHEDYQIYASPARSWITVAGIRSTGAPTLPLSQTFPALFPAIIDRYVDIAPPPAARPAGCLAAEIGSRLELLPVVCLCKYICIFICVCIYNYTYVIRCIFIFI